MEYDVCTRILNQETFAEKYKTSNQHSRAFHGVSNESGSHWKTQSIQEGNLSQYKKRKKFYFKFFGAKNLLISSSCRLWWRMTNASRKHKIFLSFGKVWVVLLCPSNIPQNQRKRERKIGSSSYRQCFGNNLKFHLYGWNYKASK